MPVTPIYEPGPSWTERRAEIRHKQRQRAATLAGAGLGVGAVAGRSIPLAARHLNPAHVGNKTLRQAVERLATKEAQRKGQNVSNILGVGTAVTGAFGSVAFSRDLTRSIAEHKRRLYLDQDRGVEKALRLRPPRIKWRGSRIKPGYFRQLPLPVYVRGSV